MPNATLSANIGLNGTLSSISIINSGSGYLASPTLLINPPSVLAGTQATATAHISGGSISAINITNPGSNYDPENPPSIFVIDEVGESYNLESLTSQVNTLSSNVDTLTDDVNSISFNVTALSGTVNNSLIPGGIEGSVLFQGAVNDILADSNRFVYNRLQQYLSVENPIRCDNPATLDNQLVRKVEMDTLLNEKQDTLEYDNAPIQSSNNSLTSGKVYDALVLKADLETPIFTDKISLTTDSSQSEIAFRKTSLGERAKIYYNNTDDELAFSISNADKLTINATETTITNNLVCNNISASSITLRGSEGQSNSQLPLGSSSNGQLLYNNNNTLAGTNNVLYDSITNTTNLSGPFISSSSIKFTGLSSSTQSSILYFNSSNGTISYGSAPSTSLSPTQATFGFNSTVTYASNYSWETLKFNVSSIGISGLTYSNGEFSIPAGTYIFDFSHPYNTNGANQRIFGYQSGTSVTPSTSFLTLQTSINASPSVNRCPTLNYTYVFSATTAFRIFTSGGNADTSGASSGQYSYRPNNLQITKLA